MKPQAWKKDMRVSFTTPSHLIADLDDVRRVAKRSRSFMIRRAIKELIEKEKRK